MLFIFCGDGMTNRPEIPLANQANAAWTLAFAARREPNWGRMLSKGQMIKGYLRASNPRIRKLAADVIWTPPGGLAA